MAVLYPSHATGEKMAQALQQAGMPCVFLKHSKTRKNYLWDEDKIPVMAIHSSKGLEFPAVVVMDASFISKKQTEEAAMRLLYVDMTRATSRLLISFHRENALGSALMALQEKTTAEKPQPRAQGFFSTLKNSLGLRIKAA